MLPAGVLKELARDLSSDMNVDKERAVSMLSSLTPYVEHHQTMLEAGVLPCLMRAVQDEKIVPQVIHTILFRQSLKFESSVLVLS